VTISNQQFTPEIITHLQALIDANPGWSRRKLEDYYKDFTRRHLDWLTREELPERLSNEQKMSSF